MQHFPFDEQECSMKFGFWVYNKHEVKAFIDQVDVIIQILNSNSCLIT